MADAHAMSIAQEDIEPAERTKCERCGWFPAVIVTADSPALCQACYLVVAVRESYGDQVAMA